LCKLDYMPELPEVETIRRDLEKELVGEKILDLTYKVPNMLKPTPETVVENTVGKTVQSFSRIAKLLLINLKEGGHLAIHLKLSGQLFIRNREEPEEKFTYVTFKFDNGKDLRFNEFRKFGFVKYIRDFGSLDSLLKEYGPEPLTPQFNLPAFTKIIGASSRPIKVVIMDQKKIAGVGNIYADEALWYARIHPETKAKSLTSKETKDLFKYINFVIQQGIDDRGTSVDTYLDAKGNKGGHDKNLQVFRRDKKPCPRCSTIILKSRVGGRGTHFCPKEQIYHD
jgi:formamidopyrimidine-DNA glycosylase